VPDADKLSWLLFGHGANNDTNLGQQNTMYAALALLGNTSGKKIAKTIGFDEFSIGQSESGLTDPQVITVAKALNEHLIVGYEQGLATAANLFKLTWQISRRWSLAARTGTLEGVDLIFNRRFD
jgi:translocation and assembly module TamB